MFEIQTATWRDLKELHSLETICFDRDAWPLLDLMAVLTFPGTIRLKAVVGDTMVGFVSGELRKRQGVAWVTTIAVLPEYRQRGIARALMDACEREIDVPRVRLCVRQSNIAAQNLYLQHGYQKVDTWKEYYSDSEDAWVYEKALNRREANSNGSA